MMDAPVDVVDRYAPEPLFSAQDRCHRRACGAQAFVRSHHGEHDLDWCLHHYREVEEQLTLSADRIEFDKVGIEALGARR